MTDATKAIPMQPLKQNRCPVCREWKTLDQFHARPSGKPQSWCKLCVKLSTRKMPESAAVAEIPAIPPAEPERICPGCGIPKPAEQFQRRVKDSRGEFRLTGKCKSCQRLAHLERTSELGYKGPPPTGLAICQRCHLHIQNKVIVERPYMFEHTPWFRPFVAGYYAHLRGLPDDRESVMANLDDLLDYRKAIGARNEDLYPLQENTGGKCILHP